MYHERFGELMKACVQGALPRTSAASSRGTSRRPERQAEVDKIGAPGGRLAMFPHEHEPPLELRDRIMEVVKTERGVGAGGSRARAVVQAAGPGGPRPGGCWVPGTSRWV